MVTALNTIVKDSLPEIMLPAPRASALGRGGHVPERTLGRILRRPGASDLVRSPAMTALRTRGGGIRDSPMG